ncbi:LysR family transcriptional regulator [Tersicoccus solisilvae]|uniref:LysR family transcriptional regulator n=1 Tax=Tersicoccus solisilvae TaxID=1882339 RepID=A0ABQ1P826_9MICC|nr:LysR family transcriptional regulator [Tersicoccus solisilvae]GGC92771.1 LysR family transcriptional regulator [Tersicoccus solisilvae]
MTDLTLRQLEYFVAVLDGGSITEAARRTSLSQSAVSMAVSQLEKAVGVPLLIRGASRRITPTAAGREFAARARRLLRAAADMGRDLGDAQGLPSGVVRVGVLTAISPRLIPGLLAAARSRWPEIRLEFVEGAAERLQQQVLDGELDIAFVYSLQAATGVHLRPLAVSSARAMVGAGHRLARRQALTFADLADEDIVLFDVPPSAERVIGMFEAAGVSPRVRYRSVVAEGIRQIVAAGLACSVTNVWTGSLTGEWSAQVRIIPFSDPVPLNHVAAAVVPGIRQPRRVEAVLDLARDVAGGGTTDEIG